MREDASRENGRLAIGLIAHDGKKQAMVDWALAHADFLRAGKIYATSSTGTRVAEVIDGLDMTRLRSGPLGGDQQIGAMIVEGGLDIMIFFVDPLGTLPHDVDVKALLRLATLADLPFACNPATASLLVAAMA
ncbi:methylglyoxal synthase [Nitrospirillum viridazoti]|uniref:Methylglyoxal synthase n=2 Tax=Nitrospirillum TaxID=1543705 RepID=A0A248K1L6_9PROT|nr:methylglyoxal synthase [Nitrospirillum amazonense]ASG24720.1 methylglyoxal synthase [Nitrospirillum amazonense CBAmc]TWB44969.1 methylglyoxal synthase [Nitrospirillum amazonense]